MHIIFINTNNLLFGLQIQFKLQVIKFPKYIFMDV